MSFFYFLNILLAYKTKETFTRKILAIPEVQRAHLHMGVAHVVTVPRCYTVRKGFTLDPAGPCPCTPSKGVTLCKPDKAPP